MRQTDMVLRHLQDVGSITASEAMQEYGIYRLVSRISDLKAAGVAIEREMVAGKNRYGDTTHFARYRLKVTPDA